MLYNYNICLRLLIFFGSDPNCTIAFSDYKVEEAFLILRPAQKKLVSVPYVDILHDLNPIMSGVLNELSPDLTYVMVCCLTASGGW